jgi:hypothetical protein
MGITCNTATQSNSPQQPTDVTDRNVVAKFWENPDGCSKGLRTIVCLDNEIMIRLRERDQLTAVLGCVLAFSLELFLVLQRPFGEVITKENLVLLPKSSFVIAIVPLAIWLS